MRPPVWLLGVAMIALIIFGVVETTGGSAAIPYSSFLEQLDAGNVAGVTFRGTQISGRFKHATVIAAAKGASQGTFRSQAPEFGDPTLLPELRDRHVTIDVVSSSNWTRWLAGLPWPMVVFLAFILIASFGRLVRGGKAQSGAAAPMHPMQRMIGMVSSLFGKQKAESPSDDGNGTKSG